MFKWIFGLLGRICIVICAITFMQIPLFVTQYTSQLIGHVAELHFHVDLLRNTASISGKSLDQYIQKFIESNDVDFSHQGDFMQGLVLRLNKFTENLLLLQTSNPIARPFVFIFHANSDILYSTFKNFTFGIPFTIEGSIYAIVGIILSYCFCSGIKRIIYLLTRKT